MKHLKIKNSLLYLSVSLMIVACGSSSSSSSSSISTSQNHTDTDTTNVETSTIDHDPTVSNVKIIGSTRVGETISVDYDFSDEDGDSEGQSIIAWSTPTKELQRSAKKTFVIPTGYVGSTISAWVHPADEHKKIAKIGYGAINNNLTIIGNNATVRNHAPSASNVKILGSAKTGKTLTLNYVFNDEDGDTEDNSIIIWSTPSKELQKSAKKTFILPKGYEGSSIGAWVYPKDLHGLEGDGYGAVNNMLKIAQKKNHVPIATNVNITGAAKTGGTLTLNYSFSDEDGDSEGQSIIVWKTPTKELQRSTKKTFVIPKGYEGDSIGALIYPINEHNVKGTGYNAVNNMLTIYKNNSTNLQNDKIGAQPIKATALKKGTIFVSPNGTGSGVSKDDPASLNDGLKNLQEGSVLFLRGGTYTGWESLILTNVKGTANNPIIIESYPGEKAIIDGEYRKQSLGIGLWKGTGYIYLRNLEITRVDKHGVQIKTSNNRVEGCTLHDNHLCGVHLMSSYNAKNDNYTNGNNIVQNNIIYNNSDAGITGGNYNDGDNADGIAISSGKNNKILNNTVSANSDDGIDVWQSDTSEIAYNLVYDNGRGENGNGNGIKLGGYIGKSNCKGVRAYAHHNISYQNKSIGFDLNAGKNVRIEYNTSYKNKIGYSNLVDKQVTLKHNISYEDATPSNQKGTQENNSWQINGGQIKSDNFKSLNPDSVDFLKTISSSLIKDIGLYAGIETPPKETESKETTPKVLTIPTNTTIPIWIIGDSTVATYAADSEKRGWGQMIQTMFKNPTRVENRARSGASAKSYKPVLDWDGNFFWGDGTIHTAAAQGNNSGLKEDINNADTSKGGILFIQFGHNDAYQIYDEKVDTVPGKGNEFDAELMEYITYAKKHNVTPILITPMARMFKSSLTQAYVHVLSSLSETTPEEWKSMRWKKGDWPQTMRDIAEREQILLIDLTEKSRKHFTNDFNTTQDLKDLYSWNQKDITHFNEKGAQKMANFIKEMACKIDMNLCTQFK